MNRQSGFTLLEVLIAFAILAMALISVVNSFSQSARTEARSRLQAIEAADLNNIYIALQDLAETAHANKQSQISLDDRLYIVHAELVHEDLFEVSVWRDEADKQPLMQTWVARYEE